MTTPEEAAVELSGLLYNLSRDGLLIEGELTLTRGTAYATVNAAVDRGLSALNVDLRKAGDE